MGIILAKSQFWLFYFSMLLYLLWFEHFDISGTSEAQY